MIATLPIRETPPCPPITFEVTDDLELVRCIITVPHIWRAATDDGSPAPENFVPPPSPPVVYLVATSGDKLFGMFGFFPQNSVTWEVHTCLLKHAAGWSIEIASQALEWVWQNTPCKRVVTHVPAYNRLALRLAEGAGLKQFGIDEKSFLKGGKLHDQVLLGVSHPEVR